MITFDAGNYDVIVVAHLLLDFVVLNGTVVEPVVAAHKEEEFADADCLSNLAVVVEHSCLLMSVASVVVVVVVVVAKVVDWKQV